MSPSPKADRQKLIQAAEEERLREMHHFAELGRLSASLLHEISNPLTASLMHLDLLEDDKQPHVRSIRRSMHALQRYVEAARQQVRRSSQDVSFRIRPELDQVKRILAPIAKRKGVKLRFQTLANYQLYGDPVKFQQIISNLIVNAIDAYELVPFSPAPKEVVISIVGQDKWIIMQVADRGIGIESSAMSRLFQPFYSTKTNRVQGLGMGLSIVRDYVRHNFGGSIRVASSPQRGTRFTVKLPVLTPEKPSNGRAEAVTRSDHKHLSIN